MSSNLAGYGKLLTEIKGRIHQAQQRAFLSANAEMIAMYWDIGRMIHRRQKEKGWGAGIIPKLATDLKNELPEVKGFSERNIGYMIRFAREYDSPAILQQPVAKLGSVGDPPGNAPQDAMQRVDDKGLQIMQRLVAQIPWGHNIVLMERVKELPAHLWYMQQTIEQGWSRDSLSAMIKRNTHANA